jgi:putative two-component system response regulator
MKKLLLVDDEPTNLNLLREMLRGRYQLFFATSGQAALDAARKHLPDLILLDISMPEMDGFEVCRQLRTETPTRVIPVVFVTALANANGSGLADFSAAAGVIAKPVSRTALLDLLDTLLAGE